MQRAASLPRLCTTTISIKSYMTTATTSTINYELPMIFRMAQPLGEHALHEARPVYETRLDTSEVTAETYRILSSLFEPSASQTSLEPTKINRQQIVSWLRLASWLDTIASHESSAWRAEVDISQQQLLVEQAVVAEYAAIPEVALIYSDRYLDEHVFTLYITGDQYDDAVMDLLLDREIGLLKRFASKPLTFHYLPYTSSSTRREMIRETAKLIFEG